MKRYHTMRAIGALDETLACIDQMNFAAAARAWQRCELEADRAFESKPRKNGMPELHNEDGKDLIFLFEELSERECEIAELAHNLGTLAGLSAARKTIAETNARPFYSMPLLIDGLIQSFAKTGKL